MFLVGLKSSLVCRNLAKDVKENEHFCSFSSLLNRSHVLAIPNAKTDEVGEEVLMSVSELEIQAPLCGGNIRNPFFEKVDSRLRGNDIFL